MSSCIPVKLKDGSTVMANVDDGVTSLPQSDIDALQEWVDMVKARHAKKNKSAAITSGNPPREGQHD